MKILLLDNPRLIRSLSDAEINFRNQKQAIYNLKNCNVLIISAGQKQSLA